ncbi:MAG TPA: hypothetical protein VFS86_07610 [Rhodanobacteraceae bacterium]|nr:hypothetical protein [Rhodanobacteraceae bacterium]
MLAACPNHPGRRRISGAAIYGVVFNGATAARLADAPAALRAQMPDSVDAVVRALHRSGIGKDAVAWLREAIALATRDLFIGMAMNAVLMLLVSLAVPRRFPEAPRESRAGAR